MNFFKKKVKNDYSAIHQNTEFNSENITLNEAFAALVKRHSDSLKDKFTSRDIVSKFRIGDRELQTILSRWIAELVKSSDVDLILTGKNTENDYVFIRGELFERTVKSKLTLADNLLNENQTYQFLQDVSGSREFNVEILKGEIQRKLKPLVKFDDGSRDMPVMLNLCKFKVPETKVLINDEVLQKYNMDLPVDEGESKKVKKMMFSQSTKKTNDENPDDIILTAFTLLLKEAGKLILTKDEILKTRAYRVFFSSVDFDILKQLAAEILKYSPVIGKDYISFYPENWLDIKVLVKQTEKEGEQSPAMKFDELIEKKCSFLSKEDIVTLKNIVKGSEHPIEIREPSSSLTPLKTQKEKNAETIENIVFTEEKTDSKVQEKKQIAHTLPKKIIMHVEKDKKKKKIEPSEPLKFLDSMIVNEKSKDYDDAKRDETPVVDLEEAGFKIPELMNFDKREKHYLVKILDSTMINSGYYSHTSSDKNFNEFLNKIEESNLFDVKEADNEIVIKRNDNCSSDLYGVLRKKIEESFLNNSEEEIETIETYGETIQSEDINTENTDSLNEDIVNEDDGIIIKNTEESMIIEDKIMPSDTDIPEENTERSDDEDPISFLDSLIITSSEEPEKSVEDIVSEEEGEEEEPTDFFVKETDKSEDLKFGKTAENRSEKHIDENEIYNIIKNNFTSSEDSEEISVIKSIDEEADNIQEETEIIETPVDEATPETEPVKNETEEDHLLSGKIISVLTDDEEKWLKIEMFSKMLGFELRDGLAYKPDIAIFDDNFKHLEPIARNSGAMILPIEDFMQKIGLGK